jgi:hypothetical protein
LMWYLETNTVPVLSNALMRLHPSIAMAYPHTITGLDLWASAA